jgi:hypothetical protein
MAWSVPPGGQLFPGWGHSAVRIAFRVRYSLISRDKFPGQLPSAQGHIDGPRSKPSLSHEKERIPLLPRVAFPLGSLRPACPADQHVRPVSRRPVGQFDQSEGTIRLLFLIARIIFMGASFFLQSPGKGV